MGKLIYTCWENTRKNGKTPDQEWILLIGPKKNDTNPKFPYESMSGLRIRFWYGHGCLGTRHWDYEVTGTADRGGIDLEFCKVNNYEVIRRLDLWFQSMQPDGYFSTSLTDMSKESFRKFFKEHDYYGLTEYFFENHFMKTNFELGIFGEAVWCG